jgi:alanine-synthesizing transaminase
VRATPFSTRVPAERAPNRLARALAGVRAQGRAIVDLTLSNPTCAGFEYPFDLLEPLGASRGLVYEPQPTGAADARGAVAREYERQGFSVIPDRIVLTASTSEAYSVLFKLLADAGDDVLVPRPSYPLFDHLTRLDLLTARPYNLEYHGAWSIDLTSVENAIGPRTRALLIVSPNNPTGTLVSSDELDRLAAICAARGIAIISDEVFADYELEPRASQRAGRVLTRDDVLSFSLGGLSKTVGLPQAKLAWIAAGGPMELVTDALERLELICDTYLSVSTPVQIAASLLFERGAGVRSQIKARVLANYSWLRNYTAASTCTALRSDAGWYAVLQVPAVGSEEELVVNLLCRDGVLTHPGYFYDFPREAYIVVSLLPAEAAFQDGVGRVLRHFACTAAPATTDPAAATIPPTAPGREGHSAQRDEDRVPRGLE